LFLQEYTIYKLISFIKDKNRRIGIMKTIMIRDENHKLLNYLRLDLDLRTTDEIITELIKFFKEKKKEEDITTSN